jgi:hypothetical protein
MLANYDVVVALTDAFCRDHLNDEYRFLAQAMTAALRRKRPSPLASEQHRTWACGIMYALGQLNFLSDKATKPYMAMSDICAAFGVSQSTASAKARVVSDALHPHRLDPTWMLPTLVDQNPLVWMTEVSGVVVDLRDMLPRAAQEIAFAKGMIPISRQTGSSMGDAPGTGSPCRRAGIPGPLLPTRPASQNFIWQAFTVRPASIRRETVSPTH